MNYADIPEENCPICLEQFDKSPIVEQKCCGKQMHLKCFIKWYERYQKNCPMCRYEFTDEQSESQLEIQMETQQSEEQDLIPIYNRTTNTMLSRHRQYVACRMFLLCTPLLSILLFFTLHDEIVVKKYDIYNTTYGRNLFTNN